MVSLCFHFLIFRLRFFLETAGPLAITLVKKWIEGYSSMPYSAEREALAELEANQKVPLFGLPYSDY